LVNRKLGLGLYIKHRPTTAVVVAVKQLAQGNYVAGVEHSQLPWFEGGERS